MAARKTEMFPIHILELSRIAVDHALQSRVSTSVEYQREFSEAMLRGDEFPPITVFFDGKKYWLADGFHRYGARKILARSDRKFEGIRAEVRNGTRDEAIVYSAGANQKFSIPRTKDDIKKAAFMLFGMDGWLRKTAKSIAEHIGVSNKSAAKYRAEYCNIHKIQLPDEVEDLRGNTWSTRTYAEGGEPHLDAKGRHFIIKTKGRKVRLCSKEEGIERAWQVYGEMKSRAQAPKQHIPRDNEKFAQFLRARGIFAYPASKELLGYSPGLHAIHVGDVLATYSITEYGDSTTAAVGRLLCIRSLFGTSGRNVIVCHVNDMRPKVIEAGSQLGIEFMTPDEFVASLKGDDEPHQQNRK
jgi:hypothetical protein